MICWFTQCEWILNAFCYTSRRLHITWFYLCSGKGKNVGIENRSVVARYWEWRETDYKTSAQRIWGLMKISLWYCGRRYITVCMFQNSKNHVPPRMNFAVCKLKNINQDVGEFQMEHRLWVMDGLCSSPTVTPRNPVEKKGAEPYTFWNSMLNQHGKSEDRRNCAWTVYCSW